MCGGGGQRLRFGHLDVGPLRCAALRCAVLRSRPGRNHPPTTPPTPRCPARRRRMRLKFTPIEDATLGFWLMPMELRHVDHPRFFTWAAPCCFKAPVR